MQFTFDSSHAWALGIGFALGFALFISALKNRWALRREFNRYKQLLSDKLQLEHKQVTELTSEIERLKTENENLRIQVSNLNQRTDNKALRELEIYARAEKQMNINAPGFAPAWELAKGQAITQLEGEERGNSFPQRIFRKLVGGGAASNIQALPAEATSNAQKSATNESIAS